jgi:predicted GNAT family acetyltransferase
VKVDRLATASEFLDAAEPFLLRAEVENALIIGLAQGLLSGAVTAAGTPFFALVRHASDVAVAAIGTLPGRLALTQATTPYALTPLADDVHARGPAVQGIVGPEPSAGAFAAHLASLRGGKASRRSAHRLHDLRAVQPLGSVAPGRLRRAESGDVDVLVPWAADFLGVVGDPSDAREAVGERLAREQLFVWEDGEPVSMAAWTGKTPSGVRVNFVYTPPGKRRRGYATAAVAALSQLLLDRGNRFCCLYTDLANPTSNAIYRRIGYRPVSDAAFYVLSS